MIKRIKDVIQGKITLRQHRNSDWGIVSKNWMGERPCSVCGGVKNREVHHKIPFHMDKDKEMRPTNWIILCESKKNGINCHLGVGHLGDYKSYNKNVVRDAKDWNIKIKNRP
jgi:5-methylcytosine-specific restriction enzyme A